MSRRGRCLVSIFSILSPQSSFLFPLSLHASPNQTPPTGQPVNPSPPDALAARPAAQHRPPTDGRRSHQYPQTRSTRRSPVPSPHQPNCQHHRSPVGDVPCLLGQAIRDESSTKPCKHLTIPPPGTARGAPATRRQPYLLHHHHQLLPTTTALSAPPTAQGQHRTLRRLSTLPLRYPARLLRRSFPTGPHLRLSPLSLPAFRRRNNTALLLCLTPTIPLPLP